MVCLIVSWIFNVLEDEGLVVLCGVWGFYWLGLEIMWMVIMVWLGVVMEMYLFLMELLCELDEMVDLLILDGDWVDVVD